MPPWTGQISELLNEEQIRRIEEALASAPAGLCVDKRGMPLKRHPGMLADLGSDDDPVEVIASERAATESGLLLISTQPLAEIPRAMLLLRSDTERPQHLRGRARASRPDPRARRPDQKPPLYYSAFEADSGPRRE